MECPFCGKKIAEGNPFCPYCGKKQPQSLSKDEVKKNPYEILQVAEDAEKEVIEAAYKSLARKYHPDSGNSSASEEKMEEINWAHGLLTSPDKLSEWRLKTGRIKLSKSSTKVQSTINQYPNWVDERPTPPVSKSPPPIATYQSTKEPSNKGLSFGWILVIVVVIVACIGVIGLLANNQTSPSRSYLISTPTPIPIPTNTYISYPSSVVIKYTNKCNITINTAIYYQNIWGNWTSEGWWVLSPGETATTVNIINPTFYTYANSSDNNWVWEGTDIYQTVRGSQNTYGFERTFIQDWDLIRQGGDYYEINFNCQ